MTMIPPPLLAPIYLRRAMPNAGQALRAMLLRCSSESLQARFLAATTAETDELVGLVGDMSAVTALEVYVDTVVRDGDHATLLAWQGEQVLAAGSILPAHGALAEVALIVEDRWQNHGLGSLMAAMLAEVAQAGGLDFACAYLSTGNVRARKLITRFCPGARVLAPEAGVIDVVIPVDALNAGALDQYRLDADGRWSR
jgi:GNAT superfamily N-acetyltransferase